MFKVNEVRASTDEDFKAFRHLATNDDGWTVKYNKNDIKVLTKWTKDSGIKMIKVSSPLKGVTLDCLYDVIHDPDYRKVWDKDMYDSYDVCQVNSNNVIGWYAGKMPPPLRYRDWCLMRTWRKSEKEFSIFNHSVNHKLVPKKKLFVRSHSYLTGYFGEKIDDQSSRITFVSQTDPKGKLPKWFVNLLSSSMCPRIIKKLHKTALSYPEWKVKNEPEEKAWLGDDNGLPKLDPADVDEEDFEEIEVEELDETGAEPTQPISDGSD